VFLVSVTISLKNTNHLIMASYCVLCELGMDFYTSFRSNSYIKGLQTLHFARSVYFRKIITINCD
jgi:hypothetical protein